MPQKIVSNAASRIKRQDFRRTGDIERRLAREADGIAVALLPLNEMWQKVSQSAPVGDEIVVDEIDRAVDAASHKLVEFGDDLRSAFSGAARGHRGPECRRIRTYRDSRSKTGRCRENSARSWRVHRRAPGNRKDRGGTFVFSTICSRGRETSRESMPINSKVASPSSPT